MNNNVINNNNTDAIEVNNPGALNPLAPWDEILQQISIHSRSVIISDENILGRIQTRVENVRNPLDILNQLLSICPKELGFSIFLCVLRFPVHSKALVDKVFLVLQKYSIDHIKYCQEKFNAGNLSNNDGNLVDTIIGEALTLVFSFYDNFVPMEQTGDLRALKLVKEKYPNTILYIDAHEFTPLHGVCCALNMEIFRFFIEWHLEQNPIKRGGLYEMNDSGITPMDTLIDTQRDITSTLHWLRQNGLLQSKDVRKWLLIHRASHSSSISTIRLFLELFPSGVLLEDSDGNLPIHLHLGLRYRPERTFSEQDFEIIHLLIRSGIVNGGINTIGGLFHEDPDAENSCTLSMLLKEAGERNMERVWGIIETCLNEVGSYVNAPIIHAAISNKKNISNELFREILKRYGVNNRRNAHNKLPLQHAVEIGMAWDDGVSDILELSKLDVLNEVDNETNLPLLPFAASKKADLSTLYELSLLKLEDYLIANNTN
jgi:ankyrin repeat protein